MDSGASSGSDASDGDDRPTKSSKGDGGKRIARKPEAAAAAAPEGMLVRGAGEGASGKVKAKVRRSFGGGAPGRLPCAPTAHF